MSSAQLLQGIIVILCHVQPIVAEFFSIIDDIQLIPLDYNEGVILIQSQNKWYGVCHFKRDRKTWGEKEASAACMQLGYKGGWSIEVNLEASNFADKFVADIDCSLRESSLSSCIGGRIITDSCKDSRPAGVHCYSNFSVTLTGGVAPNVGRVEVKYDDMWASVCYGSKQNVSKQWSFDNAQVVCKELGFPGTMFTRQGGLGQGTHRATIYGYRCYGLEYYSLHKCLHDPPEILPDTYNGPTCRQDNEAVVICAVPGYIGCFLTTRDTERTSHKLFVETNNMTIGMCRHHCRDIGLQLASLNSGSKCLCRASVTDHSQVPDQWCDSKCSGEDLEACGGPTTMCVYNVNVGICEDPLNGTDIYYYGDIFSNFSCTNGRQLEGTKYIQCVMNASNGDMQWSEDFPKCKGGLWELDIHKLALVFGASGGGLVIVISVVSITCRGVTKYQRKSAHVPVTGQMATTDPAHDAKYEDVKETTMSITPLPAGPGDHQESTTYHTPYYATSVPETSGKREFNYPQYATHIDVNFPKYATHIDDLNACKMVRSAKEAQNNSGNASSPGIDVNSLGLNYPEYTRHIDDLNACKMVRSATEAQHNSGNASTPGIDANSLGLNYPEYARHIDDLRKARTVEAPNSPGNSSEHGTFHGARGALRAYIQFFEDKHHN